MKIELLSKFYPHSLLLLGPPGVGKSETVRQLAEKISEKMNLTLVELTNKNQKIINEEGVFLFYDLRLTEVEPVDLLGLPRVEDHVVVYKPPAWVINFSKHPGILFLDELTIVQRDDVISAAYKLLLDKRAGDVPFSPGTWVIGAGNAPEHTSNARPLPAALVNRLIVINFNVPALEEWAEYMHSKVPDWDRRVYAYLKLFPNDFLKLPDKPETLENFPTPRSWSKVSQLLPKLESEEVVQHLCHGCLGTEVGEKFLTFLRHSVPAPEELVDNPQKFKTLSLDGKYIFTVVLSSWLQNKNTLSEKVIKLLKVMYEDCKELLMVLIACLSMSVRKKVVSVIAREIPELLQDMVDLIRLMAGGGVQ